MASIPASALVSVTPSVLSAGGNALNLSGLILTNSARVPIGVVMPFSNPLDVGMFFGPLSVEATLAGVYFLGFDNSNVKPGRLFFSQYNLAPVGAYLRGGNASGMGLTALQGLSGTLAITIDGVAKTASTFSLAAASSFSAAAALIQTALALTSLAVGVVQGAIAGTVLTVASVTSGSMAVGNTLTGTGVTPNTTITALLSGTGGAGSTFSVSASQTVATTAITANTPAVAYDTQTGSFVISSITTGATSTIGYASGTLAASLLLTAANGAFVSPGAAIANPTTAMNSILGVTQNWASLATTWEVSLSDGIAFASWINLQNNRYLYACWTTDVNATVAGSTGTIGASLKAASTSGTALIYAPVNGALTAAFVLGTVASIDFTQLNGRTTVAYRSQGGLPADVTNQTTAANLIGNGYNFYGAYATAAQNFVFMQPGQVSGQFLWIDSYIDQIWLNNALQLAILTLLVAAKSIPYNIEGYTMIDAACNDPIVSAVNFGAIRAGVTLSSLQIAQVNSAAGLNIDTTMKQRGWYLQVKDASPQTRAARGSPPCSLWYMDGQSVQNVNLASIEVQ